VGAFTIDGGIRRERKWIDCRWQSRAATRHIRRWGIPPAAP